MGQLVIAGIAEQGFRPAGLSSIGSLGCRLCDRVECWFGESLIQFPLSSFGVCWRDQPNFAVEHLDQLVEVSSAICVAGSFEQIGNTSAFDP